LSRIYLIGLTLEELKEYRGKEGKPIYIAIKHKIFDVSDKKGKFSTKNHIILLEMYGEGKGYHLFTGHDASVNLAMMKFETEFLNTYGSKELTADES
jgi:predicted heme/steroid binding protein